MYEDLGYTKFLMNYTIEEWTIKFDFTQIKNYYFSKKKKKNLREWDDKLQVGRKSLQSIYLVKDLYPDYIKNSQNTVIAFPFVDAQ